MTITRVKIPLNDASGTPRFVAFDYDDVTDTYTEVVSGLGGGGTAATTTADDSAWTLITGDDVQEALDSADAGFGVIVGQISDLSTDISGVGTDLLTETTSRSAADVALDGRLDVLEARRTVVRKPSDTARTSDTSVAADPHLTAAVGVGTFLVKVVGLYDSATNSDLLAGLIVPASSTVRGATFGLGIASSAVGSAMNYMGAASGNVAVGGIGVGTQAVVEIRATVVTTNTGAIAFGWAQNTSQATATTVQLGSSIEVEQIA